MLGKKIELRSNMAKVYLDLEKLKTPNSGLGQFGLHLSNEIIKRLGKNNVGVYIPEAYTEYYQGVESKTTSILHKYIGVEVKALVWHSFHQEAVYFPKDKQVKLVLTIHDLNFLDKYSGAKRKRHLRRLQHLVSAVSAVAFISRYTRKIAESHLTFPEGITKSVIYNGLAVQTDLLPKRPSFVKGVQPFLFTIGIVGEKKNFHTLVKMMLHLPDLKLFISGTNKTAYGKSIKELIKQYKLEQQVFLTGEITEEEKIWMYKNCSAFVFPSLSEGFGLPVVEAMHFGKPLVLSNKTSLPEIGGTLADYFYSFDEKEMANTVIKAINSYTLEKRAELMQRSELFCWKKAAKDYVRLYSEVAPIFE